MRSWPLLGTVFVLACSRRQPSVTATTRSNPVGPIVAPADVTPASSDECRLEPPGGVVMVAHRSQPRLAVGVHGAILWHGLERADWHGHSPDYPCAANPGAIRFTTLTDRADIVPIGEGLCNADRRDGEFVVLDVDGDVGLLECAAPGTATARCTVRSPFSPEVDGLSFQPPRTIESSLSFRAAGRSRTIFVVTPSHNALLAWVLHRGDPVAHGTPVPDLRALGIDPSNISPLRIDLRSATEASVTLVDSFGHAARVTLGARGEATEPAHAVTLHDAPVPLEFSTQMAEGRGSLIVRTANGPWHPIEGLDATQSRSDPASLSINDVALSSWTEGERGHERVRLGWFDAARGTLLGEPIWIGGGGVRAASASLANHALYMLVAWDQADAEGWSIRAAEFHCRPPRVRH